jgi:hypothetical protein
MCPCIQENNSGNISPTGASFPKATPVNLTVATEACMRTAASCVVVVNLTKTLKVSCDSQFEKPWVNEFTARTAQKSES